MVLKHNFFKFYNELQEVIKKFKIYNQNNNKILKLYILNNNLFI